MMTINNLTKFILYFCILGIGLVIGVIISLDHSLSAAESINLIDLASLITTILLAVYIPTVLDRKLQVIKDKKGLIDERVGELQALYRRINMLIQGEDTLKLKDYFMLKNIIDICQHKIETINILIIASKLELPLKKELQELKSLGEEHKKLLELSMDDNQSIKYSNEVKDREELLFNLIDKSTCLLLLKVSEA